MNDEFFKIGGLMPLFWNSIQIYSALDRPIIGFTLGEENMQSMRNGK
jgi:hypothetical protein